MGCIRRGTAVTLALLFIVILTPTLLAFNTGRVLFNGALMKRAITRTLTESEAIPAALKWLSARRAAEYQAAAPGAAAGPDVVDLLAIPSFEDWEAIRAEVMPDDLVAEFVSQAVDSFYAWVDAEGGDPQIVLDFGPFRERVNSEYGNRAIQIVYDSLEPCTPEQIADFQQRLAAVPVGVEVPYNLCQFPAPWFEDQVSDYSQSLRQVVDELPARYDLIPPGAAAGMTIQVGPLRITPHQMVRLLRVASLAGLLLPLILLALAGLLSVPSLRQIGYTVGAALTVGALLALIVGLGGAVPVAIYYSRTILNAPPEVIDEVQRAVRMLLSSVFQPMTIQAAILLLVGLGFVIMGVLARERPRTPPTPKDTGAETLPGSQAPR
ncbi:MAG: hypothetical protein Kow00124_14420 [Anaerolineae bacterium]